MADAAVLDNPNVKKVEGITSLREAAANFRRGIEELKNEFFAAVDAKIDEIKTKRAERKFEKIRTELVMKGAKYTEKQYKLYLEQLKKLDNMTEVERREYLEAVMKGKNKEATKLFKKGIMGLLWSGADIGLSAGAGALLGTEAGAAAIAAGVSTVNAAGIAGVTAAGVGTILGGVEAGGLAGGLAAAGELLVATELLTPVGLLLITSCLALAGVAVGIIKAIKKKKFLQAEKMLSDKDFLEVFRNLVNDVNTLMARLDATKDEWVQRIKTEKLSKKQLRVEYAKYVDQVVEELGLKNIDRRAIQQVFGGKEKITEAPVSEIEEKVEDEKEESGATVTATEELTEEQKKQQEEQRRLAEEQRLREEEERRKQEETNAVEEERE